MQHQTTYRGWQMGRSTFVPVAVSIFTVSAPTVFNSGTASSFNSSALHRRHLYKSLFDSTLIGDDGDVCVVLTSDVTSPLFETSGWRQHGSSATSGGVKETMQGKRIHDPSLYLYS